jgi:hypothetical protein
LINHPAQERRRVSLWFHDASKWILPAKSRMRKALAPLDEFRRRGIHRFLP